MRRSLVPALLALLLIRCGSQDALPFQPDSKPTRSNQAAAFPSACPPFDSRATGSPTPPAIRPSPLIPPATDATSSPTPAPTAAATPAWWEPPIPQTRGGTLPLPSPLPGTNVVQYAVAALGQSYDLAVRENGLLTLDTHGKLITLTLPLTEVAALSPLLDAVPFAMMRPAYIDEDPPGVASEQSYRTITVPGQGSVELRGGSGTPPEVFSLEDRLVALATQVCTHGWQPPTQVLRYYLQTEAADYGMALDETGAVWIDGSSVGQLPASEFASLMAGLSPDAFAQWADWYTAPEGERDIGTERRAIITYLPDGPDHYWVNLLSGAQVPPALQRLLEHLTDIYTRYAP